jgi:uncharacterized membrane protein YeaQ/YmgE (transglycosylase-associated protein family)
MSLIEIILLLIIAAICGGIGQSIAGYSFGGCIVSIVVGFIGAVIGQWLMNKFNLPEFFTLSVAGKDFHVVWAIIGATIFSVLVGIITRGSKKNN